MFFCMWNLGKKYRVENFYGFLGWSRDRKSVIGIAQNYRKNFLSDYQWTGNHRKKRKKNSPLQIWLRCRCQTRLSLSSLVLSEQIPLNWTSELFFDLALLKIDAHIDKCISHTVCFQTVKLSHKHSV
jgi:hypothetical protein